MSATGMSGAQPTPKALPLLTDEQRSTVLASTPRRMSDNVEDRRNMFSNAHNNHESAMGGVDMDKAELQWQLRQKVKRHDDSRHPLTAQAITPLEIAYGVAPGNERKRGR